MGWSSNQHPRTPNQAPVRKYRTSTSTANITSATLNIYKDSQQLHPFRPKISWAVCPMKACLVSRKYSVFLEPNKTSTVQTCV